ncbi:Manganese transporter smf1 [Malassezia sp. CBS 17886]|nr:Manganese transporter smf1 [Malassezia sp. CBS 17886]
MATPAQAARGMPSSVEASSDALLAQHHTEKKAPHRWWETVSNALLRHITFIGPGLIASVAYCDPGNWATDMQAGSQFGYKLLFTVLLSGLFAILLQVLCARLGTVTSMDLAVQTRRLVLGFPAGPGPVPDMKTTKMRMRYWGILIPLYLINELAIIATELAELVGSAIALNLLFPAIPLWGGVLLTSADVFLILAVYRPNMGVRIFETLIGVLVMIVLACFIVLLVRVDPNWGDVFYGYVPSSTIIDAQGLYVSISILGATIMPHSLVLGSHFATANRLDGYTQLASAPSDVPDDASAGPRKSLWARVREGLIAKHVQVPQVVQEDQLPAQLPMSLQSVQLHLKHASWDIAICLVLFAITINSAILIVASAAFYYGNNQRGDTEIVADLFQAFHLLRETVGKAPAILFAIALLAAGQSSSITVTLAGQIISEGFLRWRLTPFMRRLFTRAVAVIPSMIVAALAGRKGLDKMVALSMALPFVSFPLLVLTGSRLRMAREVYTESPADATAAGIALSSPSAYGSISPPAPPEQPLAEQDAPPPETSDHDTTSLPAVALEEAASPDAPPESRWRHAVRWGWDFMFPRRAMGLLDCENSGGTEKYNFQNSGAVQLLSWAVFLVICIADVYVLYATLKDPDNAFQRPAPPGRGNSGSSRSPDGSPATALSQYDVSVLSLIPSQGDISDLHGYLRGRRPNSPALSPASAVHAKVARGRLQESHDAVRRGTVTSPAKSVPSLRDEPRSESPHVPRFARSWSSSVLPNTAPSTPTHGTMSLGDTTPRGRVRRTPKSREQAPSVCASDGASRSSSPLPARLRSRSLSMVSMRKTLERFRRTPPIPAASATSSSRKNSISSFRSLAFPLGGANTSTSSLVLTKTRSSSSSAGDLNDLGLPYATRSATDVTTAGRDVASANGNRRNLAPLLTMSGISPSEYTPDMVQSPLAAQFSDGQHSLPWAHPRRASNASQDVPGPASESGRRMRSPFGASRPHSSRPSMVTSSSHSSLVPPLADELASPVTFASPARGLPEQPALLSPELSPRRPLEQSPHRLPEQLPQRQGGPSPVLLREVPNTPKMRHPSFAPSPRAEPSPLAAAGVLSAPAGRTANSGFSVRRASVRGAASLSSRDSAYSSIAATMTSPTCAEHRLTPEYASITPPPVKRASFGFSPPETRGICGASNGDKVSADDGVSRIGDVLDIRDAPADDVGLGAHDVPDAFSAAIGALSPFTDGGQGQGAGEEWGPGPEEKRDVDVWKTRASKMEARHNGQVQEARERQMRQRNQDNAPAGGDAPRAIRDNPVSTQGQERASLALQIEDAFQRIMSLSAPGGEAVAESGASADYGQNGEATTHRATETAPENAQSAWTTRDDYDAALGPPPPPLHSGCLHSQMAQFAAQQADLRGTIESSRVEILELRKHINQFRDVVRDDEVSRHSALAQSSAQRARLRESIASMEDLDRKLAQMLDGAGDGDGQPTQWLLDEPMAQLGGAQGRRVLGSTALFLGRRERQFVPQTDADTDVDWSITEEQLPGLTAAPWYAHITAEERSRYAAQ